MTKFLTKAISFLLIFLPCGHGAILGSTYPNLVPLVVTSCLPMLIWLLGLVWVGLPAIRDVFPAFPMAVFSTFIAAVAGALVEVQITIAASLGLLSLTIGALAVTHVFCQIDRRLGDK